MLHFLSSVFWGFITGILSGTFGIGGSIISTPALRLAMGTSAEIALGTPLPAIIPSAVVAGYGYAKANFVDRRLVWKLAPFGILGSITGSFVTGFIDSRYIMIITAIIILYVGYNMLKNGNKPFLKTKAGTFVEILIGFSSGFISGFLGVGGGIVLIPAFLFILNLPIKVAMGTSLVIISAMAIPGTIVHYFLGHIDILIFLGLTVGVIPGSRIGSLLAIKARESSLKKAFGFFLLLVGIIFIINELKALSIITY